MLTVSLPDAAETRCNTVFEALMWAMARPGQVRDMGEPGLAPVIEALIDRECVVHTDSATLSQLVASTGATPGTIEMADHLFHESLDIEALVSVRCGSALYPDDGATVVLQAAHGSGARVRLSGPGVDGACDITLAVPPAFWSLRAMLCAYPEGFDLLLVDARAVIGIPRSTHVEVL
jgi:alpha-D-ribose 1-methylphosphonate 5-triphosphate synthase subunit PhnH